MGICFEVLSFFLYLLIGKSFSVIGWYSYSNKKVSYSTIQGIENENIDMIRCDRILNWNMHQLIISFDVPGGPQSLYS